MMSGISLLDVYAIIYSNLQFSHISVNRQSYGGCLHKHVVVNLFLTALKVIFNICFQFQSIQPNR